MIKRLSLISLSFLIFFNQIALPVDARRKRKKKHTVEVKHDRESKTKEITVKDKQGNVVNTVSFEDKKLGTRIKKKNSDKHDFVVKKSNDVKFKVRRNGDIVKTKRFTNDNGVEKIKRVRTTTDGKTIKTFRRVEDDDNSSGIGLLGGAGIGLGALGLGALGAAIFGKVTEDDDLQAADQSPFSQPLFNPTQNNFNY